MGVSVWTKVNKHIAHTEKTVYPSSPENASIESMLRRMACLLGLLLVGGIDPARAQTVITGKLLGVDGTVMPAAHVEVYTFFRFRQVPRLIEAKAGRYRVEVSDTGLVRLHFYGPLHRKHEVIVLVEGQPSIKLDVQLQQEWLDPDQSFTRVATSYTNFDYNEGIPMEEQADGSYTAVVEVPGDSLAYTLPAARSSKYRGLVIESITADHFEYSRQEGYVAVVAGSDGEATVTLRPKRLETEEPPPPVVSFDAANPRAAALWEFYRRMHEAGQFRSSRTIRAGQVIVPSSADADRENVLRQELLALEIELKRETDPFRKHLLMVLYLQHSSGLPYWTWGGGLYRSGYQDMFGSHAAVRRDFVARIIEEIPPTSLIWTIHSALLQVLVEASDAAPDAVEYVERVIDEHPVGEVRQYALFNLIDGFYARRGLTEDVAAYIEKQGEARIENLPAFSLPLQKDLNVTVGRKAPGFGVPPWEPRKSVSSDSLKGQIVLLNFWTPRCDDCNADADILRQMHETYGAAGLRIVRVSLEFAAPGEPNADAVPWLVYQGEDGFKSRIAMSYEVLTLPHRVLIDRDGVILAVGAALFGNRLTETLDGVFQE